MRADFAAGDVLSFGADDIHRLGHRAGEPAITIHAYSGRVARSNHYEEGLGGALRRRSEDLLVRV